MNINTLPFPKNYMSIPRSLWFFLLTRWFHQNVLLLPQLFLCLRVNQSAILHFCQHTKLLYTVYRLRCCLLFNHHMDWPGTPVISESLHKVYTIIAQAPYNHIKLSIVLVILPSRKFTFKNLPYVMGSPCTGCPWIHLQFLIRCIFILAY